MLLVQKEIAKMIQNRKQADGCSYSRRVDSRSCSAVQRKGQGRYVDRWTRQKTRTRLYAHRWIPSASCLVPVTRVCAFSTHLLIDLSPIDLLRSCRQRLSSSRWRYPS